MQYIDDNFTEVVVKATGEKTHVPSHWLDDQVLGQPFQLPPSARSEKQPKTPAAAPATDKTPAAGD